MTYSLSALGGQVLGMILIISGTVLGLHGSGGGKPLLGTVLGIGETPAGVVLFLVGIAALVLATLRGSAPSRRSSNSRRRTQLPAIRKPSASEPRVAGKETSADLDTATGLEALIRWDEQARKKPSTPPPLQADMLSAGVDRSTQVLT